MKAMDVGNRNRLTLIALILAAVTVIANSGAALAERPEFRACGNACNNGDDDCANDCFCVNGNQWCESEDTCSGWPCSEEGQCGDLCHCVGEPYGYCDEDLEG
jgi:hypothetical protein